MDIDDCISHHPLISALRPLCRRHKYAYVFVAYDKSGYAAARQFSEQLQKLMNKQEKQSEGPSPGGGRLKEQFVDSRSELNPKTLCTDFNLESSTVTILESPEFHCNMQKLRSLFMDHKDLNQAKWGVKVVHLVRNPFTMAVANYQDRKGIHAPEEVRFKDPCSSLMREFTAEDGTVLTDADLTSPILSENGIMTREDFDSIVAQCKTEFQTEPGMETASYYQHLNQLPRPKGLRLAVADRMHNIALMASDLLAFERVNELVKEEAENPERKKIRHFDIMTVPLDTVLKYPGDSMMHFLDFVFGTYMSASAKRQAATEYEQNLIGDQDVDAAETSALIELLQNDPVVRGPLKRIETLLDSVLAEDEH